MAISAALLGSYGSKNPPFTGTVTLTYSPAFTLTAGRSVIRFPFNTDGYTVAISDTQGNAYSSGTGVIRCAVATALSTSDVITVTLTPTNNSVTNDIVIYGYVVDGVDSTSSPLTFSPSSSQSGLVDTVSWSSLHPSSSFPTAVGGIYVFEGFFSNGFIFPNPGPPTGCTVSIAAPSGHTSLTSLYIHDFRSNLALPQDEIYGESASYRIYTGGPGDGETDTTTATFNSDSGSLGSHSYTYGGTVLYFPDLTVTTRHPAILAPQRGGFHIAYAKNGDINYKTSQTPGVLSLGSEISVTGGTADSEPVMVDTHRQGRIYLAFVRGGDTYYCYSDGDGEDGTWSTPVSIFSGCKHPAIAFDRRNGMLWLGAWDPGTGHIKTAAIQPIGAAPTSPVNIEDDTGTALVFDDDTFQVAPAYEGSGRWELIAMQSGVATVWQSVDDGNSFIQVV